MFLPVLPEGADGLRAWLAGLRGGPVDFRVPRRGRRALLETVAANAREAFATHKLKRASDFDARARGLKELQEALDPPEAPRIECYDISNLQGSQVVGSMVVFEDGLARKSEYRRFEIRSVEGQDDVASLREVLTAAWPAWPPSATSRRRTAAAEVRLPAQPDRGRRGRPWPPPWRRCGPRPAPSWRWCRWPSGWRRSTPGHARPGGHPRTSEALYLLQQVRDEAHRFAITYHRKLRDRSMTRSVLDGIPGVGRPAAASWCATSARPARPPRPAWRSWSRCPASAPSLLRWCTTTARGRRGGVTRQ